MLNQPLVNNDGENIALLSYSTLKQWRKTIKLLYVPYYPF